MMIGYSMMSGIWIHPIVLFPNHRDSSEHYRLSDIAVYNLARHKSDSCRNAGALFINKY